MNQTAPPQNAIDCLQVILDATASKNYELFTTVGDAGYKTSITQKMFDDVSEQLASRMEKGYSINYFGEIKQGNCPIYLWKLSFEDGGDEFVAHMTMNGDQVAGIFIE
ncbi:hypothetical protein [Tychonema sp. LEGE 07203]|uniref:hypothetical protein n=1 Tax=Tychonema sp. LEGE 07203 TaxID=1828671 RepID=UPI001881AFB8|nr:hypothetical protein [Tychonema sp. LEGE 07203]MBE9095593.1 hypothetical protein [Tychonema sp. LEGE 07203]